ncbi:hypothetical protein Poly30_54000 [Planctomycetes bacterium Poly30]|uniref:AlgX/AlgJ SGNH hydrolase-like domain-containing protein n=1 Tax=Saltatorellus ferox TaxID=2528018 RepID=A0A518F0H6_9BACT|nr:hypothetical protein Poly30_54000 [Planctomycetes bacterium Poly30]
MSLTKELIELPAADPGRKRWVAALTVIVSLGVLSGTGAVEVLMPPSKRMLIGEEKEQAERAARDTSWWDGSRARSIETDFRLRGRVRREVAPYWGLFMLALGDVPSRALVVGKNGHLFYRERIARDPSKETDGARLLAKVFGAIDRCLAARGSKLIVVPLPRKVVADQAMLPKGLEFWPEYDRFVIDTFKSSGIRTVDLLPRWTAPGAESIYLRHDSHWARAGVVTFADEVAHQVPDLPRNTATIEYVDGPPNMTIGVLTHAGILPRHPSHEWANPQVEPAFFLLPPGREQRIDSGKEPAEILLAGSSFCDGFFARAILAYQLQAPVIDASLRGRLPVYSLSEGIRVREPDQLPRFLIAEFPIHQAEAIRPGAESTMRACFTILNHLYRADISRPLPADLFPGAAKETPRLNRPLIHYPPGTLLSSGDGILAIRVDFESEAMTQWRLSCSGMSLSIRVPPGRHTRILPVFESDDPAGSFWLAPVNEPALGAGVTATVVTDVGLSSLRPLALTSPETSIHRHSGPTYLHRHDALLLQWEEPTKGPFVVEASGRDFEGKKAARRWSFERSEGARAAAFTLGHLALGHLDLVTVTGPEGPVTLHLGSLVPPVPGTLPAPQGPKTPR